MGCGYSVCVSMEGSRSGVKTEGMRERTHVWSVTGQVTFWFHIRCDRGNSLAD